MNNDSASSPAADLPLPSASSNVNDTVEPVPEQQVAKTPAQKKAHEQSRKKHEFLEGMMVQLDNLVYVELCVLYYMDCSLFRLLLRFINQIMFLSPNSKFNPLESIPHHRPYLSAIFAPNLICTLLHIFTARSEAGETTRGYLHGGMILDLIGQKGPTSKVHLVILDIVVLALQCFMLTVYMEKQRISAAMNAYENPVAVIAATPSNTTPRAEDVAAQDVDSEERGIMRDGLTNNDDIELQTMGPRHGNMANERDEDGDPIIDKEREQLLAEPQPRQHDEDDSDSPLDMFYTGNTFLADFNVAQTLKRQWDDYGNVPGSALQAVGFSAEIARISANRNLNAATQRLQRQVDSLG